MQIVQARIDGQHFMLAAHEDVPDLKRRIVAAARGGADFVEFETPDSTISVLITSVAAVRFEVIERSDEQFSPWQETIREIDGRRVEDSLFDVGELDGRFDR